MRYPIFRLAVMSIVSGIGFAHAAGGQEHPPSILEMLRVTEAKLKAAVQSEKASDYDRAPVGRKIDFRPLHNTVLQQADERIRLLALRDRHLEIAQVYKRIEQFPQAEASVRKIITSGNTGEWRDHNEVALSAGLTEAMLAAIAAYRQNDRYRQKFLEDARRKFEPYKDSGEFPAGPKWIIRLHIDIAEQLPEITRKAAGLQAELAAEPNADKQLELALLFARNEGPEVYGIQFLRAALDFKYMYPSHPAHAEGVADDLVAKAYIYHDLFQQALDHINKCIADGPESNFVTSGTAAWRLCRLYQYRGWRTMERGDTRGGQADLRRAIEAARRVVTVYPNSRWVQAANSVLRSLPQHL